MQTPGTALVAINESIAVWEKMVLSGGGLVDKNEVCGKLFGAYPHHCPLCAYSGKNLRNQNCAACPYHQEYGACEKEPKPYHSWKDASSAETRRKYALACLEQLHALKVIEEKRPTCPFKVGDMVRVKDTIKTPTGSWGSVVKGDVGRVTRILDSNDMFIDFPNQSCWTGRMVEMELAPVPTSKPKYEVGDLLKRRGSETILTVERVTWGLGETGVHLDHKHWHYHMVGVGTPKDEADVSPAPKMVDEERWVDVSGDIIPERHVLGPEFCINLKHNGNLVARVGANGISAIAPDYKVANITEGQAFKGWMQVTKKEVIQVEAKSKSKAPKGWGKTTRR